MGITPRQCDDFCESAIIRGLAAVGLFRTVLGALIGVLTAKDRELSKPKDAGFAAQNWLQNDGDKRHQAVAAERWVDLDETLTNQVISPNIGRLDWAHVVPKKTVPAIDSYTLKQVFIASITLDLPETYLVLVISVFAKTGSLKIFYK